MHVDELVRSLWTLETADEEGFDRLARAVFEYQRASNPVYSRYCNRILDNGGAWKGWRHVPFLPVQAFKLAPVTTGVPDDAEAVFESSGTGTATPSKHYVQDLSVYERSVTTHFEAVFGGGPFTLLAHLPGYAERGHSSSLVYMLNVLIERVGDDISGFFLADRSLLDRALHEVGDPSFVLFGATFGLLDLVEQVPVKLPPEAIVIETGGMKTYRRELSREELHERLATGFGLPHGRIRSEYGMCELLSQCYTRGDGVFYAPPWMRFRIVDPEHPQQELPEGKPGALAVFDLANVYSVSALLTEDRAVRRGDGFEVLGRLSGAELRGCNFLVEEYL